MSHAESGGRRLCRHIVAFCVTLMCAASGVLRSAQEQPPATPETASPAPPAAPAPPQHRVPRSSAPIQVDGVMDEPQWQEALRLEIPWEVWPGDNVKAVVPTDAYLMYDDAHLYAAFKAHDPDAGKIRARLSDRDRAFQDDFVGIVVDTFNDRRRGFEFFVNALGVQMDLTVDDVSGNEDDSWDAIWSSAGRTSEDGYVVELAIPYTSLRFQRGEADQVWGLDLIRIYPRDRRYLFALQPRDRNTSCYLCQVQTIVGFAGAEPGRNLELTPTATATRTDIDDDAASPGLEAGEPDYELGGTAKWGITPNMTASGAINPDFSQVEADSAQLSVNEQFALFFPEKRPFFLEGADFFQTPLTAFYSRTVADPLWGAKLTGKEGRSAIGAVVARDEQVNFLFPGSQSSSTGSLEPGQEATAGVLRYRMDVGKNSTVGGLVTGRDAGDYYNYVVGADALLRPQPADSLRVQALVSRTNYSEDLEAEFGLPRAELSDRAFYANYHHTKKTWWTGVRYQDLGPEFRADMGFIPQVGVRSPLAGAGYIWIGDPNSWYSRIEAWGDWDEMVDSDGMLIEREFEGYGQVQGPLQSYLLLGGGGRLRGFRSELFSQEFVNYTFEFQPNTLLFAALSGGVSDRIDFTFQDPADPGAARQGYEIRFNPWVRLNLGRRIRAEMFHNYLTLEGDDGYFFRANQSQLTFVYQMTLRAFVRAIVQYTDVRFNTDQYQDQCLFDPALCPADRTRDFFTQLLFSYKINPQSVLFLGYSDSQFGLLDEINGVTDDSLEPTDQTFFVKLGYAWVF